MPLAVWQRLERDLAEATARHMIMSGELGHLLKEFDRERIPVIPLKGPVLAETLYRHPALRPCSDLDLLIRRESIGRVDELLRRLGYRRLADEHSFEFDLAYDHATLYEAPSGIHVDLHCLLYLAVHLAVHHSLAGLLWYYDLFLLIDRSTSTLDWPALSARASGWRVRAAVYFVLREVERLFGAGAPAALMAGLEPRGPRAAAMAWLLRHRSPSQRRAAEHLIGLLLVDRDRDLLGALRSVFFPPYGWLQTRYEGAGASRLAHYVAHYRRLGQVMAQAASGLRKPRP